MLSAWIKRHIKTDLQLKQRKLNAKMMNTFANKDKDNTAFRIRINGFIRAPEVRVIASDGTMLGVMQTHEALKLAQEQGLDLIEINPKATPVVVRIADFGKFQYEESKKQKAEKKKQKQLDQKTIELRPTTDENDIEHKMVKIKEFLSLGHRVKLCCKYRGREMSFRQLGQDKLTSMLEQLSDLISGYTPISMEGRDMSTVLSPKSTK
jgi:translation initiation factor IF-3